MVGQFAFEPRTARTACRCGLVDDTADERYFDGRVRADRANASDHARVAFSEWRDTAHPDDGIAVDHAVEPACLLLSDRNRLCIVQPGIAVLGQRQVPPHTLQAIALNSISYAIARSFGPAIGGVIVGTAGAMAAFATNAFLYLPLIVMLILWRRTQLPSPLPLKRLDRAINSGRGTVIVKSDGSGPKINLVMISRTRAFPDLGLDWLITKIVISPRTTCLCCDGVEAL